VIVAAGHGAQETYMASHILASHVIPMEQLKGGGMVVPRIEFSEDGSILTVLDGVDRPSLGWYARTYAPDAAGIGLMLALLLACVLLVRVLRFQRERGRIYCRKCNQELVEPQVRATEKGGVEVRDALAQCPECGVVLGSVLPVMGRGRSRRSVPLAIGAIVIAAGFVYVIVWSTRPLSPGGRRGRLRAWSGCWWDSRGSACGSMSSW